MLETELRGEPGGIWETRVVQPEEGVREAPDLLVPVGRSDAFYRDEVKAALVLLSEVLPCSNSVLLVRSRRAHWLVACEMTRVRGRATPVSLDDADETVRGAAARWNGGGVYCYLETALEAARVL